MEKAFEAHLEAHQKLFDPLIQRATELIASKPGFSLEIPNPDRTTTKSQWKAIQHFSRSARRKIHENIDYNKLTQSMTELAITGRTTINA
jgi:hypothetical protein